MKQDAILGAAELQGLELGGSGCRFGGVRFVKGWPRSQVFGLGMQVWGLRHDFRTQGNQREAANCLINLRIKRASCSIVYVTVYIK